MINAFTNTRTHLHSLPDAQECDPLQPFSSMAWKCLSNASDVATNSFTPFLKWLAFKLMEWQYTGSMMKSAAELQQLVDTMILDKHFNKEELVSFHVECEQHQLNKLADMGGTFSADDSWWESSIWLNLPKHGTENEDEESTPGFLIKKIWMWSFIEVIKMAFCDPTAKKFHWFPHLLL